MNNLLLLLPLILFAKCLSTFVVPSAFGIRDGKPSPFLCYFTSTLTSEKKGRQGLECYLPFPERDLIDWPVLSWRKECFPMVLHCLLCGVIHIYVCFFVSVPFFCILVAFSCKRQHHHSLASWRLGAFTSLCIFVPGNSSVPLARWTVACDRLVCEER